VPKTGKGLGKVDREFNRMDTDCAYPHSHQAFGKVLLCCINF
jgi:hypothetical protein